MRFLARIQVHTLFLPLTEDTPAPQAADGLSPIGTLPQDIQASP
jgi:hypothetical protein